METIYPPELACPDHFYLGFYYLDYVSFNRERIYIGLKCEKCLEDDPYNLCNGITLEEFLDKAIEHKDNLDRKIQFLVEENCSTILKKLEKYKVSNLEEISDYAKYLENELLREKAEFYEEINPLRENFMNDYSVLLNKEYSSPKFSYKVRNFIEQKIEMKFGNYKIKKFNEINSFLQDFCENTLKEYVSLHIEFKESIQTLKCKEAFALNRNKNSPLANITNQSPLKDLTILNTKSVKNLNSENSNPNINPKRLSSLPYHKRMGIPLLGMASPVKKSPKSFN